VKPLDIEAVRRRLPGRRIDWYATIDSTMHAAASLPPGSVVVAEEQTAGQGRHGRAWHSEGGAGLYCSLVLRPAEGAPVITLALGLGAAEAMAQVTGLRPDLRWPNDLMAGERKLAGILVQAAGPALVAGIGINVNHRGFPAELAEQATSLRLELGREVSREDLLAALLPAVDSYCKMLMEGGKETILKLFARSSSYARGKRVVVEQPGGAIRGVTAGLDPSGFLRVRRDDGTDTLILAGGVRAAGS
jgi:BirA family transcriptional regulator, biotin operon repressor / biotin---[acetyl-CoA-carboxylase] ligase